MEVVHAEAVEVEAVTAAVVMAVVTAVVVMAVVTAVAVMAVVTAAVVVTAVAVMAVVTAAVVVTAAAVILNQMQHMLINHLEQKAGKIGVMETLLKTLNLKIAEVEEKEVLLAILKFLKKVISNPFLVVLM